MLKVKSSLYRNIELATTAKSGYIQRRIVKICEDLQVQYDGTVRDTTGRLFQVAYGDNGLDPKHMVNSNDFCDVSRIVNSLNMKRETDVFENKTIEIELE